MHALGDQAPDKSGDKPTKLKHKGWPRVQSAHLVTKSGLQRSASRLCAAEGPALRRHVARHRCLMPCVRETAGAHLKKQLCVKKCPCHGQDVASKFSYCGGRKVASHGHGRFRSPVARRTSTFLEP